jgi:hypothetical protein
MAVADYPNNVNPRDKSTTRVRPERRGINYMDTSGSGWLSK